MVRSPKSYVIAGGGGGEGSKFGKQNPDSAFRARCSGTIASCREDRSKTDLWGFCPPLALRPPALVQWLLDECCTGKLPFVTL